MERSGMVVRWSALLADYFSFSMSFSFQDLLKSGASGR
jgi:hypothetical protein